MLSGTTRKFAVFILKHPFSLRVSELIGKLTWGLGISVSGAAVYTNPTWSVISDNVFILGAFMMILGVVIEELSIMIREKKKEKK
ncbi:hypothetical protein [Sulfurimonas sp.]|uniref:hypothetical protein n=1 Tax=Sulfurimonas sp. TaxID=2022749 RepID=UPI0025CB84BA|nr:hypothetical protein [Sulfurimonas sp.]MBW6487498.1 hypothetical protein [Sulfurimonas sp.]